MQSEILRIVIMKKSFLVIVMIISVLSIAVVSCKKKENNQETVVNTYSPAPGENYTVPTSVLPTSLESAVTQYITIYSGDNPPRFDGQFVSSPHVLIHSTIADDIDSVYNDRYIAFYKNNELVDFYGKQWDDEKQEFYHEAFRKLYILGTGEAFSCYYITEGYPNGMYAKQSTVFSGKWNESYHGLKDFQVAVMLLETSGNPNLAPVNSFRVLGDGNGLADTITWIGSKRAIVNDVTVSAEDAFSLFRVK